jgi:hypothetical protein
MFEIYITPSKETVMSFNLMNIYYVRVSDDRMMIVYVRNEVGRLGMMWVQSSHRVWLTGGAP